MRVQVERVEGRRLRVTARGVELIVDRTPDQGGPGDGFRPTELLLGALGACMAGTLLTFCDNQGIEVGTVTVDLEDTPLDAPKRIGTIDVRMTIDGELDDRTVETLGRVAARCKIHNTLTSRPVIDLEVYRG